MNQGFGGAAHLARRFMGSLRPGGPGVVDDAWARSFLKPGEQELWTQMSGPDRRHAVAVARALSAAGVAHGEGGCGPLASDGAVPAALLHDVGKVASSLGTLGRAVTTALALIVGRERIARGSGAMARYLRHDALGADLLVRAGSDALTEVWAREHHLPPSRWSVPPAVGEALKAADDDEPRGRVKPGKTHHRAQ